MQLANICNRHVIQCGRDTPALEVAQIMRNSHVGDVIVVDRPNGECIPVGIVTDRDLVVAIMARELDPATVTAGEIMSSPLVTAAEADDIHETAELMRFNGVRRIPLVDEQGALVGIATLDDILSVVGEELTLLGRVMKRERLQEQQSRP